MAKIKFYKGPTPPTPSDGDGGDIWFNSATHTINVWTGSEWQIFSSNVQDIIYQEGSDKLVIIKVDGSIVNFDLSSIYTKLSELESQKISFPNPLGLGNRFLADDGTFKEITSKEVILDTSSALSFYCIEPVTVIVGGNSTTYEANSSVTIYPNDAEFEIVPTSDKSIQMLTSWPGALSEYYSWLEGVMVFVNIVFNMNDEAMYTKWSQGNQGLYHVQYAQYVNCIFWSDNGFISDVSRRTNYTLYNTSQLPLCYSTIPDNTFKAFYFAYNVTSDPNWSNPAYKESFAKATWATQVFSYYGLKSIGMFDMDSSEFNITLPKDCRGLMFYAPNIQNAGVFDAINCTNFGAKSGSWRDAFAYCYSLENLYIKNLKVNLNVSWSPISQQALEFILSNAANTAKITISLSPYTWYRLTDSNRSLAAEKNITLALIATNATDDNRLSMLETSGDGSKFLANDGTYKDLSEYVTNESLETKVNEAVAGLVDNAPETLDTLGELAAAFKDNSDVVDVLNSAIARKSDVEHTHDERYYTRAEVNEMLSGYVSKEVVAQMITDAIANLNNPDEPETPVDPEPDTPVEPEEPTENIGLITEDNSIVIDETRLENGTYTLRYIDANDNIIGNFNEITSFEINN